MGIRTSILFCFTFFHFLALCSCLVSNVHGYSLIRKWEQAVLGDPVTLTYSYSNLLDGGMLDPFGNPLPEAQLLGAVEEALSLWASMAPLHFVEVEDDGSSLSSVADHSVYPDGDFGQLRLGHHAIDGFGSLKAHAYYPPASFSNLAGDVHFDNQDRWQLLGTPTNPDVLGGAIHELGHSLGLGHSDVPGSNMRGFFPRFSGPGTGTLHADDIAGIQAFYGAGAGSVTPLARIPEPSTLALLCSGLLFFSIRCHCPLSVDLGLSQHQPFNSWR